MAEFLARLKQRKLVQWALAYIAATFALIQVLDVVAQRFGWSARAEKFIILALALGFIVVLVLAWYHGEKGRQWVSGPELLLITLVLAVGGVVIWRFLGRGVPAPTSAAAVATTRLEASAGVATSAVASTSARAQQAAPVTTASIPAKSVAVLPFVNESGNKDQQYFSDGLSEDLITALSQFAGLKVISRNSAFQFRNSKDSSAAIGKALGVAHLLEGTVQRAGDEVRVTAALVNAADGSIAWQQRYDKPYKDLFALQDAITKAVAGALKAKLLIASGAVVQSERPPSGNLAAYAAYQRGIAYYALGTEAGYGHAVDAFSKAIQLDPRYAAAYAWVCRTRTSLAAQFSVRVKQEYAKARKASARALALNRDSALAHGTHAFLLESADMNWTAAAAEYRRALQLAPRDAWATYGLGQVLAALGHNRRAVQLVRQALDANPRNAIWYVPLSRYLVGLDGLREARQAVTTAIALNPGGVDFRVHVTIIDILRGNAKAALSAAKQEPPGAWHDVAMAMALQIGLDRTAADSALKQLIANYADSSAYQIAQVYALRSDPDAMFHWLDRAWTNRDPGIALLLTDPMILRYKDDPRFAAFCKKVGLPTTTDAVAMTR